MGHYLEQLPSIVNGLSHSSSVLSGLLGTIVIGITYVIGCMIYNVYFHPLAKYPGPSLWAATPIPYIYYTYQGRMVHQAHRLHMIYGEVVRTMPGELSYNTAEAWKDIYAHSQSHSQLIKDINLYGRSMDAPNEHISHLVNSYPADHSRFRRLLSHGFSDQSLRGQESLINEYICLLMNKLRVNSGNPINLLKWYNFNSLKLASFDIVGDLVFGESFDCLTNEHHHPWVAATFPNLIATALIPCMNRIPGISKILSLVIPKQVLKKRQQHNEWTSAKVKRRLEKTVDRADLLSPVVDLIEHPRGMSLLELEANANALILAGSETTASVLSGATYLTCRYPEVKEKLVREIRDTFASEEEINFNTVNNLTYMIAVLSEVMRIYPIVPIGLPRIISEGGLMITGKWVPGGTVVSVSALSAAWSPNNFLEPQVLHPERWLGNERFEGDKLNASQPFSIGPRNCLGKNLALAEMRTIFGRMIWNFDIELLEDSKNWTDQKAYLVWEKGPLNVKLTPVVRA